MPARTPPAQASMPATMILVTRVLPLLCCGGTLSLFYNAWRNPISREDLAALEIQRDPDGRRKLLRDRLANERNRLIDAEAQGRERKAAKPSPISMLRNSMGFGASSVASAEPLDEQERKIE